MTGFHVKPPKISRPVGAGKNNTGDFKPTLIKGLSRLYLPAQISDVFGRVQTHAQQGIQPPPTNIRLTDVCRFWAARLSTPVNFQNLTQGQSRYV